MSQINNQESPTSITTAYDLVEASRSRPLTPSEIKNIFGACLIYAIIIPTLGFVIWANFDNGYFQHVFEQFQDNIEPLTSFLHQVGQGLETASKNARCLKDPIVQCGK